MMVAFAVRTRSNIYCHRNRLKQVYLHLVPENYSPAHFYFFGRACLIKKETLRNRVVRTALHCINFRKYKNSPLTSLVKMCYTVSTLSDKKGLGDLYG